MSRLEREWDRLGFTKDAGLFSGILETALHWEWHHERYTAIQKEVIRVRDIADSLDHTIWNFGSDVQVTPKALDNLHKGVEGGHLTLEIDEAKEKEFLKAVEDMKALREKVKNATRDYHATINEAYNAVGEVAGTLHRVIWGI